MGNQSLSNLLFAIFIIPVITASIITLQSKGVLLVSSAKIRQKNDSYLMERSARQVSVITSTITEIKTKTITKKTTIGVACAKLVNISGPCRRQRGHWVEEPIVLTFDDITEKLTEILYTPVFGIEITETPQSIGLKSSVHKLSPVEDSRITTSMRKSEDNEIRQSRIFFREFADLLVRFFPQTHQSSRTTTTTITITQDRTKSIIQTSFSTNTFFIQKCTPSPFPFKECRRHGFNSSSLPSRQ